MLTQEGIYQLQEALSRGRSLMEIASIVEGECKEQHRKLTFMYVGRRMGAFIVPIKRGNKHVANKRT